MKLRDIRNSRKLTIKEVSLYTAIEEKRIKILERELDKPNDEELEKLKEFLFENYQLKFDYFTSEDKPKEENNLKLIGEGYVTAVNNNFKVYEPLVNIQENKLKVLDLFCGIGGLSYGFEQTNQFETIGGLDLLDDRIRSFQQNHKHSFGFSYDIRLFKPSELDKYLKCKPNVIVGGAPCQGFSSIRPFRNLSEDDLRNNLFKSFANYLNYYKPDWFVFENVVGLLTHKKGETLQVLVKEFESIGYQVDFKVLNAAYYGVPQLRERLIIVGNRLNIKFNWPLPTHYCEYKSMAGNKNPSVLRPLDKKDSLPAITVMDALNDLSPISSGENSNLYLDNVKLNDYQMYLRDGNPELKNHDSTKHSEQMLNIIRHSGFNIDSVKHLVTSGFSTSYSRLEPNKPSVTLTVNFVNPSSNKCIHPTQERALTPREGARLQGFPDKFEFCGSRTQIVKQIGNAVPPILSRVIAESIFSYY